MNSNTLEALKSSIAHWKRLSNGKTEDNEAVGGQHCALCKLFIRAACIGCPVKDKTGEPLCWHTPYGEANDAFYSHGVDSQKFKNKAKLELAFLRSLLPRAKATKTKVVK